ncbi:tRNA-dihydrouridine synthase, partial [Bacillus cereus]
MNALLVENTTDDKRGKAFGLFYAFFSLGVVAGSFTVGAIGAFRLTVKEFGAGLVCAEMVSDKAILLNNKRTLDMLYIDEREK